VKYTLAIVAALFLGSAAHAQIHTSSNTPTYNGGAGYGSSGPFTGGYGSSSFSSGFSGFSSSAGAPVVWQPPREFMLLYANNDGSFVPSTFMKYEDALALGKQQIAQQELDAQTSPLADAARNFRAEKVPTFRLKSRVVQDNSGKLQICNLNGNDCHRI
jgi:hypothetical protein